MDAVMALMSKIYAPTPAQSLAAAKGMAVSKVASLDSSIDETSQSNITPFDEEFILRQDSSENAKTKNPSKRNLPHNTGRLLISSEFFTTLMDYMHNSTASEADPQLNPKGIVGMISKAIQTYETNAKVIYGNPDVTGTKVSIRL